MWRQENNLVQSVTGGSSVPLFNQKKRNRVPLTSAPSATDFFSHSEYRSGTEPDPYSTGSGSGSGPRGCYETSGPSQPQQYNSHRPAPPGSDPEAYALLPHPYKGGDIRLNSGQSNPPLRHQDPRLSKHQGPYDTAVGPRFSPRVPVSLSRPPKPSHQQPKPSAPTTSWNFTNSFGPQPTQPEAKTPTRPKHIVQPSPAQTQSSKMKVSMSLRILTATIDGMKHWSQFKDKVPTLFEIFATLDSAVTVGSHGAKNFLLRDGKEVAQCVYYENEEALPRLIRGHVHRCVGNYDRSRNILTCVSVRPGHPSEMRNAHEAVKLCDAEMGAVVKIISEV